MVGFIFTLCLLCILALVGFLFAWMVRLASFPETKLMENDPSLDALDPISSQVKSNQSR